MALDDTMRTNPDLFRDMVQNRTYMMPNAIVAIGASLLIIAVIIFFLRLFRSR